jgi:Uma2 family endonuclease
VHPASAVEEANEMATVATNLLTAEQFYEWANRPENRERHCELESGEIVEMSRPGILHGLVCANVAGILRNYAVACKKGFVCSNDTGIIAKRDPDTVRGPDVLFFEDVETVDQVDRGFAAKPPLLSVEVLSPNDTTGRLMRRVREQMRFGIKLIWVLDPDAHNVIVYRSGVEDAVLEEQDELTGGDVLPGFRCRVHDLYALPGK